LPVAVHELVIAPLAFVLALVHARRALGLARAAGELLAIAAYGYALEAVTMSVFRSHRYSEEWRLAPLGVPVAVALVWAAVISAALALAARRGARSASARAVLAALFAVTLDLMIEPVAVRAGLWQWTPPGPWLKVPVGNFVGWLVIVGVYGFGAERWAAADGVGREILRRVALATGSLGCLVAIGLAWRRGQIEGLFRGHGAWLPWAVLVAATAAFGRRAAPPFEGDTLAGRLGAAPGAEPAVVVLVLATSFAADAALIGEARIGLAALGPVCALLVALRPGESAP
jgi:hypothetical protein